MDGALDACQSFLGSTEQLTASDAGEDDQFGSVVAASGSVAVVGAPYDDDDAADSGGVYVFRYDDIEWTEEQRIVSEDNSVRRKPVHVATM